MTLTGFRPRLAPTLFALPTLVLLLGLGGWQVQRHNWKAAEIAKRQAAFALPPVALPAQIDRPQAFDFRQVTLRGTFLHEREQYVVATSPRGNNGFDVLTPLKRDSGAEVMINRGWVPLDRKLPATRPQGQVGGVVDVVGILREPAPPGWLMPDNKPGQDLWYVDLAEMARRTGLAALAPYYIQAVPEPNPGGYPLGRPVIVDLPSNHLGYAATWFILAAALIGIYIIYHRQPAS